MTIEERLKKLEDIVSKEGQQRIGQMDVLPAATKQAHLVAGEMAAGDLYFGDGANNFTRLPVGSTGQLITSVNGLPAYGPSGLVWGDIFYVGSDLSFSRLGAGTSGQFLKTLGVGANPAWATVAATGQADTVILNAGATISSNVLADLSTFSITMTTTGGNVFISFTGTFMNDNEADYTTIALLKDASEVTRADGTSTGASGRTTITITYLDEAPTVASHTYKIQWRNSGGNTSTWVPNKTQFTVIELA